MLSPLIVILLCVLIVIGFFSTLGLVGSGQIVAAIMAFASTLIAIYVLCDELKRMADGR